MIGGAAPAPRTGNAVSSLRPKAPPRTSRQKRLGHNYTGSYVDSISINGAVISVQYGNDANAQINGETITITAVSNPGSMEWVCATSGTISETFLPTSCR